MTLRDVLSNLHSYSEGAVICVEAGGELSLRIETTGVDISEENPDLDAPKGMRILVDVWHAEDTLNGLKQLVRQQTVSSLAFPNYASVS
jgi:hypothetical protein